MQNFTTSLKKDLVEQDKICLPAGHAKFTIVDVNDIGRVAASVLANPRAHVNMSYELTNNEVLSFSEMADQLSEGLHRAIRYISPNLITFYCTKRREHVPPLQILVMIMLHYFPRFQKTPSTTTWIKELSGQEPLSFQEFIVHNKEKLMRNFE